MFRFVIQHSKEVNKIKEPLNIYRLILYRCGKWIKEKYNWNYYWYHSKIE